MPRHLTFLPRPVSRLPPRRVASFLAATGIFALFTLLVTLPTSLPTGPSLSRFADTHVPKIPAGTLWTPFQDTAHAPPVQKNSSSGQSSWFSDWKWLKPYSSQITLDENRSLLPPLPERPPIYTYYDHIKLRKVPKEEDEALRDAENQLLLTWRRAWWAQGFKPIILGPAEALKNAHYEELQSRELDDDVHHGGMKTEMLRWLAWESMGTGLLCNYLTLPMAPYDNPLLSFLRRGTYPTLTRFEGLGSGIFAGDSAAITSAVKAAISNPELKSAKNVISAVPKTLFEVDPQPDSLAYYSEDILRSKYAAVNDAFGTPSAPTPAKGLSTLDDLINAHLHNTWQSQFPEGIAVLKPGRIYMNALLESALELATHLAQCAPANPAPSSCAPNVPNAQCVPCVARVPMKVTTPENFRNKSDLYTIGIVPHPYTFATLSAGRAAAVDVAWIRASSPRDPWLHAVTKVTSGTGVGGGPRVLAFKEAVASPRGLAHGLWMPAEQPSAARDLDWRFGFAVPRRATAPGRSATPGPGPERRPPAAEPDAGDLPLPSEAELAAQKRVIATTIDLLARSGEVEQGDGPRAATRMRGRAAKEEVEAFARVRRAVEMWNLADTEAWRFAKAFEARARVERARWEEEERPFGGTGRE